MAPTTSPTDDPKVRHTTLEELNDHLNAYPESFYHSLPTSDKLRFEVLAPRDITFHFLTRVSVIPARLILGSVRDAHADRNYVVYAYLCKKEGIHRAILRLGKKNLPIHALSAIDFKAPFDHIYREYDVPDRACDRMSLMAAYYFLAAGYIDKVTTRLDFCIIFTGMCNKLFKPTDDRTNDHINEAARQNNEMSSVEGQNGEYRSSNSSTSRTIVSSMQTSNGNVESNNVDTSGNGVSLSTIEQLSLVDFSQTTHQASGNRLASSSGTVTLADHLGNYHDSPKKVTPDIEDLTVFIQSYKALKASNLSLSTENATLMQQLAKSQAYTNELETRVDTVKLKILDCRTREEDLHASLAKSKTQSANAQIDLQVADKERSEARAELKVTQKDFREFQDKAKRAQQELQQRDIELAKLRCVSNEKAGLEDKLKELQVNMSDLARNNNSLLEANFQLSVEMERIKVALGERQNKVSHLKVQNEDLKKENEGMAKKFANYKRLLKEVTSDM
ncbi:hypothetical protein P280DRAFT_532040 [Massarina eburnea CBS 473.64]|uniref:Uncharacterized protein n=1 Tax=Massarina eburnea CBS 473.64 TaxID=1395130 RepID=A0A6A6SD51_9PLEO|nr:hypothetical protein P280DRAFT_532040 [Massarina eburnea CBS 473.64]